MEDIYGTKFAKSIKNLTILFSIFLTCAIHFCSTRISKVGKCAAFQLWTSTIFFIRDLKHSVLLEHFEDLKMHQKMQTFFSVLQVEKENIGFKYMTWTKD